jgi:hypothetical protein
MSQFSRRYLLGMAAGFVVRPAFGQSVNEAIGNRLSQSLQSGNVSGLHALLVSQGDKVLFEYYGQGEDYAWGLAPVNRFSTAGVLTASIAHGARPVPRGRPVDHR